MSERITTKDLLRLVAQRTNRETAITEEIMNATLEEIYEALKRGESSPCATSARSLCGSSGSCGYSSSAHRNG